MGMIEARCLSSNPTSADEFKPCYHPRIMDIGKVFISSILNKSVEDLRAERNAAKAVIESYGFLKTWAFEDAPASPEKLDNSYLRHVDECDLFILLVGAHMADAVEAEYYRAKDRGRRIFVFAKNVPDRSNRARALLDAANSDLTGVFCTT